MHERLRVLFLCTGNSCRSQMAEGWTRHLKGDVVEPYSGGVDPGRLDSRAVAVMEKAGVDISNHSSKPLSEVTHVPFDVVVTVCGDAHESCPVFPGPLVEVPVLIGLVNVSLAFQKRYFKGRVEDDPALAAAGAEACKPRGT